MLGCFSQSCKLSQQNPLSKWDIYYLQMKFVVWGLLLCEHFYCFIFAVIMSLLLQVLMMSIKMFHCMWRHILLTVEKKPLSALPQLHRHCRTTAYQIMNVRSTHNQHITGQWIIKHSIINLNIIWYIWSRF
jgi:hypothetical protein